MRYGLLIILLSFVFLQDDKWHLSADGHFEQIQINNESVQRLSVNVNIYRDTLLMITDVALKYSDKNELHLLGNTIMISGPDTLTCDSMIYWMDIDSLTAMGHVYLQKENSKLNSDYLNLWKSDGFRGNSFLASGNVIMEDGDKIISADVIQYNDISQQMTLDQNASISEILRNISGDVISVQYQDSLISEIDVGGNAYAVNDLHALIDIEGKYFQFRDEMSSLSIHVDFEKGEMSSLALGGMATSTYHVVDDSLLMGVNHVSGDTIILRFEDSDLDRILVSGGARGEFIPEKNSNVDSLVTYQSEFIDYRVRKEDSILEDNAKVLYQDMDLQAGYIHVDWRENILHAKEKDGEIPSITTATDEPMTGQSLTFDLITRHGIIDKGKTKFNDAYYQGEEIYRDEPNIFHVNHSIYTSCDLDKPHFYFGSRYMKMIPGDRVIAKPLILYIYDIPLIGFPLAVFPNKGGGRHSGWIMPSFGYLDNKGNFLRNLGYYWAPNDYVDARALMSFYDRHGITFKNRINYKKRYKYSGKITSSFLRKLEGPEEIELLFGNQSSQSWDINWQHTHKFDPTQNLNINYTYVSSNKFYQDTGYDLDTRLKQKITSSLNYSKNWSAWKNSLTLNISEIYDLLAEDGGVSSGGPPNFYKTRSLPRITFRHGQSALFGVGDHWYNSLYWSMSSKLIGNQKIGFIGIPDDSVDGGGFSIADTSSYDKSISHNLSFILPQKFGGWLTLSPRLSLKEHWIFRYRDYYNGVDYNTIEDKFKRRLTGSASLSANTKIYGILPVSMGKIEALRHVITPSISFTYQPDFTKSFFGYDWGYVHSINGALVDPYKGSMAGSTPSQEQKSIGINIHNLFQIKTNTPNGGYTKNDILSWSMRTSYNAAAESLHWSNIRSTFKTTIPGGLHLDISTTHDLYRMEGNTRVNQFQSEWNGLPIPYMTRMDATTSFSFAGRRLIGFNYVPAETDTSFQDGTELLDLTEDIYEPQMGDGNLWEAGVTLRYNLDRIYQNNTVQWDKDFWMSTRIKLKLSESWKLSYNIRFDLEEKKMLSQSFHFYRPLHCWEFTFKWWPGGISQGFFLEIHVKNPDLRDIKLESRGGKRRLFGF